MEALSVVVNSKLVADDVRHSVGGYDEVKRIAAETQLRRKHRLWSALRRSATALRRSQTSSRPQADTQVECTNSAR